MYSLHIIESLYQYRFAIAISSPRQSSFYGREVLLDVALQSEHTHYHRFLTSSLLLPRSARQALIPLSCILSVSSFAIVPMPIIDFLSSIIFCASSTTRGSSK